MVNVEDPQTCGAGLAHNAVLPAKMADVIAALANVLRSHLPTIDTSAEAGRQEYEAYVMLARRYDTIASELGSTAAQMAACRDLPMAPHIEAALTDPRLLATFETYVQRAGDLLESLSARVESDRSMLAEWQQSS